MKIENAVKWQLRFQNFQKAFTLLSLAFNKYPNLSDLEMEGMIQRFEYTFELAWKTLKDYLENQGITAKFPREVIKQAFHYELIEDGELWMDMLNRRNELAHTYDEANFRSAVDHVVHQYFSGIMQVYELLKKDL